MCCPGRVQTLHLGQADGRRLRVENKRKSKLFFSLHTGWLYDLISELHIKIETDVAVSDLFGVCSFKPELLYSAHNPLETECLN